MTIAQCFCLQAQAEPDPAQAQTELGCFVAPPGYPSPGSNGLRSPAIRLLSLPFFRRLCEWLQGELVQNLFS